MYNRLLDIAQGGGTSAFLWGPRKTGKSFYLRHRFPRSTSFDFLKSDVFFEMSKSPALLRQRLLAIEASGKLAQPIILDEIQKVTDASIKDIDRLAAEKEKEILEI